jgi:hypothetical protein
MVNYFNHSINMTISRIAIITSLSLLMGCKYSITAPPLQKIDLKHQLPSSTPIIKKTTYNYTAPGKIPLLQQENTNACWATVVTMLISWKEQKEYSVEDVLKLAGNDYVKLFDREKGLSACGKKDCPSPSVEDLLKKLSLRAEAPQSFTEKGWLELLKNYGPLWITSQVEIKKENKVILASHARILFGMRNDENKNIFMKVIDPFTGTSQEEKFEDFVRDYERSAFGEVKMFENRVDENGEPDQSITFQPQVIHF